MRILITGGAGFIGKHLTRHLLSLGHEVTILDNFLSQVHADKIGLPTDFASHVRLITGDVADRTLLKSALGKNQVVIHLAAETGTGQSMYELSRYERTNIAGTALLYDLIAKDSKHQIERIIVASSRAIYGEGAYECEIDGLVYPAPRLVRDKQKGIFDLLCPQCDDVCRTIPTPESAPYQPASFYGLTKQVQEQTALMFGKVFGIPTFGLRYQNVYGPGQSLQNPYTGILAIFSNLARTGRHLQVFEDGLESRDFVYIEDVVGVTSACIHADSNECHALNVGSGERTSVLEVANQINAFYGNKSEIKITGAFREGDIRHGMADLSMTQNLLGYKPSWTFQNGLKHFLEWANENEPIQDGYEESLQELKEKGLLHGK